MERFCGREFTTTTEVRFFDVPVNTYELLIGDIQEATQVAARGRLGGGYVDLPTTGYSLRRDAPHRPYRRIRRTDGYRFQQGEDNVRINATWGMTPPDGRGTANPDGSRPPVPGQQSTGR